MKSLLSILAICTFLIYSPVMLAADTGPATGTVAETMESGSYVYIRLEDGVWIAATSFAVSEGDKIQYSGAMEMNEFHSKSLDRTFESILFVSQAGVVGDDGAATKKVPLPGTSKIKKPVVIQAPAPGEIKPLPEGKTIADIYAESDELKNQVVSLNARVVKVNRRIMGKNWITLKDGTGSAPDNKIVATSQEELAPGDLVIVKGTLATEVDLGRGYSYKVLLEEATFSSGLE